MILFLDNNVLPGIKPDLSDLVESYAKNIIRDDVYHNVIVDKYEMAKQWNVPFVELLPSQDKDRKIAVIIGTYSFESVKRGKELIWFNYHCATLYDFTKCPRIEGPIFLQGYSLKKVEASYKEIDISKEIIYFRNSSREECEFSNELISFDFYFSEFEIHSEDLVHKLINKYDINTYKYRKTKYKKALYWSIQSQKWYDYGEARSLFNLKNILKKIDALNKSGLRYQDMDFDTFGTKYINGEIVDKFEGFAEYDDFISSIASSKVKETEGKYLIELDEKLSSRLIPYYRFLFENLLCSAIEQDKKGNSFIKVDKRLFNDSKSIIPCLIFNVMSNIDNENDYIKYVHTRRYDSDEEYSQIINFKGFTRCLAFELRVKDILQLKAKDEYEVLYQTGDRDDIWFTEKQVCLEYNSEIDTATIFLTKQVIPGIVHNGNYFEYNKKESGECDRFYVGHAENNSKKYKMVLVTSLCKAMYDLYKSGIWENNDSINKQTTT